MVLKVSVKQLEMAHSCPRKWALHYLFGAPQLEGDALVLGNALHAQMKALLTGAMPSHQPESFVGKMARELLQYAQNRSGRAVAEIERVIELPEYGFRVDLRADYLDKPVFKDWKTTGAPSRAAKLPNGKFWALQSLQNSWQANVYAFLLMREHWKGLGAVEAEWCYVSKKFKQGQRPVTWTVPHVFEWETTKAWFEKHALPVVALIKELRELHEAGRLDTGSLVPHNAKSCEFRGLFCDAAGRCGFISSPVMSYDQLHLPVIQG